MIKAFRICLAIFFLGAFIIPSRGQALVLKKDLATEWLSFEDGAYHKFEGPLETVYVDLDANRYVGNVLLISHPAGVNLFINGKFAGNGKEMQLSIDSLAKRYTAAMQLSVRPEQSGGKLTTHVLASSTPVDDGLTLMKHKDASFRDFSVVAALIIILLLIVIIRLNPKLASDYFSIQKIFSLTEGEDSQTYSRITNSTNILFYLFCSLMLGYFLMVVFQFVDDRYTLAYAFVAESFGMAIWLWIKLSVTIMLLFFAKIILVYSLAYLFGMQTVGGVHFFNWIRLILVIFGATVILMSFYFMGRGDNETFFNVLFQFFGWALAGWMIIILFKLRGRTDHSVFHLFSYICATELIPFLFIIKILYN
ncbi:DUF4271 domain-containing protein [Pseudochryseolinea flava]|uniref:DUF4271 domain-containing protein n=1 Tax=Pseudochryseolinea flava TaxID=2059302 RepID=A0A364Y893_9BACT|nr:DUF4271 domain-containing protein [Pseudochryseolinea flava]RAW03336.1 hypothetical protein DQQ10_04425 [Pseudochryseolinea flava]